MLKTTGELFNKLLSFDKKEDAITFFNSECEEGLEHMKKDHPEENHTLSEIREFGRENLLELAFLGELIGKYTSEQVEKIRSFLGED